MANEDIKTGEIQVLSSRLRFAVTVLLEKRRVERRFWHSHAWYLDTVALGEKLGEKMAEGSGNDAKADNPAAKDAPSKTEADEKYRGELAYQRATGDVFRWSGFVLTLYKDACERYWHALISDEPKIYVVCREADPDVDPHDIVPLRITADYDEALAFAETDDLTLTGPLPPELYRYMEAFVLAHYRPVPFKKRKRKNWSKDETDPRLQPVENHQRNQKPNRGLKA